MNLFKWLKIPTGATKEVKAYENWAVRYTSRVGNCSWDVKPEAEFFTNEQDARDFAEQLRAAFKLVKNTVDNRVTITKS